MHKKELVSTILLLMMLVLAGHQSNINVQSVIQASPRRLHGNVMKSHYAYHVTGGPVYQEAGESKHMIRTITVNVANPPADHIN